MIIINSSNLQRHTRLQDHARAELAARLEFNSMQRRMAGDLTDPQTLAINQRAIYTPDYWLEIDRTAREVSEDTRGREIYDDLQAVVTVQSLGKTLKAYTNPGDISDDVRISMDGQTPITFDQVGYGGDADPIPMFTTGFGVDWRDMLGAMDGGLDKMLDSERAKLKKFYGAMNRYLLGGSANISVAGFKGQGIKNHRNTEKIDLASPAINLTTASADDLMAFFNVRFAAVLDDNNTPYVDVLWVSKEIRANLRKPFSTAGGFKEGTVEENILKTCPWIKEIRTSYSTENMSETGLVGNEFLAYVRNKTFIEIPTGQAVTITPMPRLLPRQNFNNDVSSAWGVQIRRDGGNAGVFYAGELT